MPRNRSVISRETEGRWKTCKPTVEVLVCWKKIAASKKRSGVHVGACLLRAAASRVNRAVKDFLSSLAPRSNAVVPITAVALPFRFYSTSTKQDRSRKTEIRSTQTKLFRKHQAWQFQSTPNKIKSNSIQSIPTLLSSSHLTSPLLCSPLFSSSRAYPVHKHAYHNTGDTYTARSYKQ